MIFSLKYSVMVVMVWQRSSFIMVQARIGNLGDWCAAYGGLLGNCTQISCPTIQRDLETLPIPQFIARHGSGCGYDGQNDKLFCCPPVAPQPSIRLPSRVQPTATPALPPLLTEVPTEYSDINDINILQRNKCNGNAGAVGMYTTTSGGFFLICRQTFNEMSFSVDDPKQECRYPNAQQKCLTTSCLPSIYRGFVRATYHSQGPCGGVLKSDKAVLDVNDCHTVSGNLQPRPGRGGDWLEWRLCGGDITNFYAMTAANVTDTAGTWTIPSITCCRIKRL